jgi:RNA polymerase sigma-70 factor (ECF subfamily)
VDTVCDARRLAEQVRTGDMAAIGSISRCYGERLLAVGLSRCRDRADAEDAVQDALLSAGRSLQGFRGEGTVESWLTRMVVNACSRMRRGQKNDPARHDPDAVVVDHDTPEASAARRRLARRLESALATLSPLDRVVVVLSDVEGWSAPQIAEELTMKPGTVRVRLHRARGRLREILDGPVTIGAGDGSQS